MGSAHLINLALGSDINYEPVALDHWNDGVTPGRGALHTAPGSDLPSLDQVSPMTSNILVSGGTKANNARSLGPIVTSNWNNGLDAVSAVLMAGHIDNEYITDPTLLAGTDWVVTFPTKHLYTARSSPVPFEPVKASGAYCDSIALGSYGDFSPYDYGMDTQYSVPSVSLYLCGEVNVIPFGTGPTSNVLSSRPYNPQGGTTTIPDSYLHPSGWASGSNYYTYGAFPDGSIPDQLLDATGNIPPTLSGTGWLYHGLPMIGFAAIQFQASNGAALASYGAATAHRPNQLLDTH